MQSQFHFQKINQYTGHQGSLYAMTTDAQGHTLYTSGDDGMVAAWDLRADTDSGTGILRLSESVYALCHMSEANYLLVGTSIGHLYVVDLAQKQIIHRWRLEQAPVYALHFDEQHQEIWVLHAKGYLSIIKLPDFAVRKSIRLAQNHLRSICQGLKEGHIWIGSSASQIIQLEKESLAPLHEWQAHANSVFALAIHPEGKYLLSGGRDAYLKVWDLQQDLSEIRSIPAHHFTINDISLSPKGDYFVTASRDKTIKLWDAYSFELLKVVDQPRNDAHTHSVNRITWLQDGSIVSCSDDRIAMRWRVES